MSSEKEEILNNITVVVRALITSHKPPVSLREILRDYQDVEGQTLPYRKLGYRDAEDMLRSTQAFTFNRFNNEVFIIAKYSALSEHIASAVRCQKRSKGKSAISRTPQASVRQNCRSNYGYGGGGGGGGYNLRSNVQPQGYKAQVSHAAPPTRYPPLPAQKPSPSAPVQKSSAPASEQRPPPKAPVQKPLPVQKPPTPLPQQENQLTALQQEVEQLRKLQRASEELRQRHEREVQKSQSELRAEQQRQKAILEEQQAKVEQQLKELQERQQRGHEEQELRADRAALQRKKEALELLHQQERENEQLKEPAVQAGTQPASLLLKPILFKQPQAMNGQAHAQQSRKAQMRPILGHTANPHSPSPNASLEQQFNTPPMTPAYKRHPHLNTIGSTLSPLGSSVQRQSGARTPASSVNDRLKLKQPSPSLNNGLITPPATPDREFVRAATARQTDRNEKLVRTSPQSSSMVRTVMPRYSFDPALDAVSSLRQYCVAHGYTNPVYEFYNTGNSIHCTVRVHTSVYSSYPKEYPDKTTATLMTAEVALERLQHLESRKHLPVCTLSDAEFVDALFQELLKYPHGIVSRKLPEWYEATFKHQVPNHWWSLVNGAPQLRLENPLNMIIIYAQTATPLVSAQPETSMPELQLPWPQSVKGWSFVITHCSSTALVWGRMIGGAYNNEFNQLTIDLDTHMAQLQLRQSAAELVREHQIFAVQVNDCWNRVRVLTVDAEQRNCTCHFVDYGDVAIFTFDELYVCEPAFMKLAPQAVCMSLYALENYVGHPYATHVLNKELVDRTIVARIVTTEAQFIETGGRTQGVLTAGKQRANIVALFYDTSTDEDIALNEVLATRINHSTPAPLLKLEQKTNPVLVSHINDVGDLFVLLPNEDLKFVQRSIAKIMAVSPEQHRVVFTDLEHDCIFFVSDETSDGAMHWYRGVLTTKPKSADEETFDVYYVDDGRKRKTHISNVYRLEALNMALATFPPQALRVRLHDVPPIDNQMVGRLRGLMSPHSEVLLKVMEGANEALPMVTIHARGQDGLYLCVNSAIRMEYEVQSTARLEPYDDSGLHFGVNGQLLRRSSFSSTLSSNSSSTNGSDSTAAAASSSATPPVTPFKTGTWPMLKVYEAVPAMGAYFEVRISLSINPGHFAVQPYKSYNQLQRLMKDLQAHCKSVQAERVQPSQLRLGQAYATPDGNGVYHRVNIFKIYDEMIHVRFVDIGDDSVVRCNQLLQLPAAFRELPKLALPAHLYGIKVQDVVWTQENCLRFRNLTVSQKFIAIVHKVEKLKDETRALCLELIDTSTPKDIKLHEILISEEHAQPLD